MGLAVRAKGFGWSVYGGLSAVAWFSSLFSQVVVLVLPARSVAVMHAKLINQYM